MTEDTLRHLEEEAHEIRRRKDNLDSLTDQHRKRALENIANKRIASHQRKRLIDLLMITNKGVTT